MANKNDEQKIDLSKLENTDTPAPAPAPKKEETATEKAIKQAEAKGYAPAPSLENINIANLAAATWGSKKDKEVFSNKYGSSMKKKKSGGKFNFIKEIEASLPSHGYFYQDSEDENLRDGIIRISPMTLADEEMLTNQSLLKSGTLFTKIFESCISSNYPADKFCGYDTTFIMYLIRQATYGDDYGITCKCPECEKNFDTELKISDIEWEELTEEDKDTEIDEIHLQVSGYTVFLRRLRVGDSYEVHKLMRNQKKGKEFSEQVANYCVATVKILDDAGDEVPKEDWAEFYQALPGMDRSAIIDSKVFEASLAKIEYICPECGHEWTGEIPYQASFFRARRK